MQTDELSFEEFAVAWVGAGTVDEAAKRAGVSVAEVVDRARRERADGVWLPVLEGEADG